ncbi:hypothetical protein MVEN_00106700 [Mycena venus]|uniref:Uncharacterized protein n=1 Tax=Mycena venus TaxID=2733690 RepID=A0A8H6Z7T0_9AGAR|nr:hypothetical protein MVEN_00106700 [Mycena venus]
MCLTNRAAKIWRSSPHHQTIGPLIPSPVLSLHHGLPTMTTNEDKIKLYDSWTLERRAEEHQYDIACAMKWYTDPTATYNAVLALLDQVPRAPSCKLTYGRRRPPRLQRAGEDAGGARMQRGTRGSKGARCFQRVERQSKGSMSCVSLALGSRWLSSPGRLFFADHALDYV